MNGDRDNYTSVSPSLQERDLGRGLKAMIFAAGLGTRLKPITDTMPKALVPVGGKPLLEHVILKLKAEGFDEIIINIHHFGQQIIDFVRANNSFGIRIEFSDEREKLLNTGGGIKKAAWFFDDNQPFLIHNVDILSNVSLRKLYAYHQARQSVATLVCSERKTSRYLLFNPKTHDLNAWINEKTGEVKPDATIQTQTLSKLAFSGIHVLSPAIFKAMENFPDAFSIIDFYLDLCTKESIQAFTPQNLSLLDVGKIDSLDEAEKFIQL